MYAWSVGFHALLHQVPEQHRAYRDTRRRSALLKGYGTLQPGVLIALRDLSAHLESVLARCPAVASVARAELRMGTADAACAARAAWDLTALERTYRAHSRNLRRAVTRSRPPG